MNRIALKSLAAAVSAAVLAFAPTSIVAQDPSPPPGRGYFSVGYIELDLEELNGDLQGGGLPALDGSFLTLGGGGYGTRGRLLIGGEGHGLLGSDGTTADGSTQVSVGGGYGLFKLGYLAFAQSGLEVFPSIGIGGGGMHVQIVERSAPTFGDIIDDPQRSSKLSAGSFLMDVAGTAHFRFAPGEAAEAAEDDDEGDAPGGMLVGLQVGYTFAPGSSRWTLDDINNVAGGPTLNMQGFYFRVSVGGWNGGDR